MKETIKIDYDIQFKSKISNIHSISIDTDYKNKDSKVVGNFIISGDYKDMGITLRYNDFKYEVPFIYDFNNKVNNESIKVEIDDFTYEVNDDILTVHIEYSVYGEILEIESDEDFTKFIVDKDIEVVDLREEEKPKEIILPSLDNLELESELKDDKYKDLISNVSSNEEYITYHVYQVNETDSIESILTKYNINLDTLKTYNEFDEIKSGMKLIIPYD